MTFETVFHGIEALGVVVFWLGGGFKALRAMINLDGLLREFPLHLHINGHIHYPKGMRPNEGDED